MIFKNFANWIFIGAVFIGLECAYGLFRFY